MPINSGQSHLLPNGFTTITLNSPDNSNKPKKTTANKPNETMEQETNNADEQGNNSTTMTKMIQQIVNAQNIIQQDIQNIKQSNNNDEDDTTTNQQ